MASSTTALNLFLDIDFNALDAVSAPCRICTWPIECTLDGEPHDTSSHWRLRRESSDASRIHEHTISFPFA